MFIFKTAHQLLNIWRSSENLTSINQAQSRSILDLPTINLDIQQTTVMESNPIHLNMSVMFSKHKTWPEWLTNSITSKKDNITAIFANLSDLVSQETTVGHNKLIMDRLLLVFHLKACIMLKIYCMFKAEPTKKVRMFNRCIERPMEILHQVNRNKEITIGTLIQLIIDLGTERKKYWMAHNLLFIMKEMMKTFPEQLLFKRQLKITKQFQPIYLVFQRIWVKDKTQEEMILFMVLETSRVVILGMLQDVFMENHLPSKSYQIETLVNQLRQTAETL